MEVQTGIRVLGSDEMFRQKRGQGVPHGICIVYTVISGTFAMLDVTGHICGLELYRCNRISCFRTHGHKY